MKIIHVTTLHSSTDPRIYYRQCRSLAEIHDYEVHLAAPSAEELDLKVNAISLPRPFKFRPLRLVQSSFSFLKLLTRHRADVWHLHDPELLPVSIMASFFVKDKFIWDSHENYIQQLEAKDSKRTQVFSLRLFLSKIVKLCLTLADKRFAGIVVATPSIGMPYRNRNTKVIPNFVDRDFYRDLAPHCSNNYFLFIGAPNASSLLDSIINAGRRVNFDLVIAGEKPNQKLVDLGKQIFGKRISFLGFCSHEKLRELLSGARFGFVTYSNTVHEEDAFPTKLGEFCASGIPIISTPNAFLSKLNLERFGYITEGFGSNSIAKTIEMAMSCDDESWHNFSKNGLDFSNKVNWQLKGKPELLSLYKNLETIAKFDHD